MRVVAVGRRPFVTAFRLVGADGMEVDDPEDMLRVVDGLYAADGVGLVLLDSELYSKIRVKLADYRKKKAVPLIYAIAAPGAQEENSDYSKVLRAMLGV